MTGAALSFEKVSKAARFMKGGQRLPDRDLLSLVHLPRSVPRNCQGLDFEAQQDLVAAWAITQWTGAEEFTLADLECMRLVLARLPEVLLRPFSPSLVAAAAGVH